MPSKIRSTANRMPAKLRLKLAQEYNDLINKVNVQSQRDEYTYHLVHSKDVDETTFSRLMDLFEPLMGEYYSNSSWGWNREQKLREWKDPKTRIVVVTEQNGGIWKAQLPSNEERLIAFMCFRFEFGADKSETALYVYELHVDRDFQRKGLGEYLMEVANSLSRSFNMDKTMLTVFRANKQALQFYKKLRFSPDKSSPESNEQDYIILSFRKNS